MARSRGRPREEPTTTVGIRLGVDCMRVLRERALAERRTLSGYVRYLIETIIHKERTDEH